MIVRDDIAAETYEPLPFSPAEYRRLRKAFRDHAPEVALERGPTDTGVSGLRVVVFFRLSIQHCRAREGTRRGRAGCRSE
jgi:hypothetical protein